MLTYGDGVADVNIRELLEYHRSHGKMATITAAQPGGRFGILDIQNDGTITNFKEKKKEDGGKVKTIPGVLDTKENKLSPKSKVQIKKHYFGGKL